MNNEKRKKRLNLKADTVQDIHKSLKRVANMLLNDDITPDKASKLTYNLRTILECIKSFEIEKEYQKTLELLEANGIDVNK